MANDSSSPRLIVPAMAGLYDAGKDYTYPAMRFFAGLFLVPHGAQKLFEWVGGNFEGLVGLFTKLGIVPPEFWLIVVGIIEFFGGILIAIGLLTRPAALAAAISLMIGAIWAHMIVFKGGFFWTNSGYEYPMLWSILCIVIFFRGGGKMSVDAKLGKEF